LIVYVWFNDGDTMRKAGANSDVYAVSRRMLSRGQVPASLKELLAESTG
jgi:toxin YhaV